MAQVSQENAKAEKVIRAVDTISGKKWVDLLSAPASVGDWLLAFVLLALALYLQLAGKIR